MGHDISQYESRYADQYERPSFEPVLVRFRRRRVLQSVGDAEGCAVLEVGCGLEPLAAALHKASRRVVVEPAPRFAAAAAEALREMPGSKVVHGFLEEVAGDDDLGGPFDVVIASSVLHEVADPDALLEAIRKCCRPGALVHVNVPNVRSFHRLLALEAGIIDDLFDRSEKEKQFQRHTRFDIEKLCEMVGSHGFRVERSGSYFLKPFTHDQMQLLVDAGAIDDRVMEGLDAMVAHLPGMGAEIFVDARA